MTHRTDVSHAGVGDFQLPPTLRGVRTRWKTPRVLAAFQGCSVWCFGARLDAAGASGEGTGASATALARAVRASDSSFSRQHCLYLRPDPQRHGSLRPGRSAVVVIIVSVEYVACHRCNQLGKIRGREVQGSRLTPLSLLPVGSQRPYLPQPAEVIAHDRSAPAQLVSRGAHDLVEEGNERIGVHHVHPIRAGSSNWAPSEGDLKAVAPDGILRASRRRIVLSYERIRVWLKKSREPRRFSSSRWRATTSRHCNKQEHERGTRGHTAWRL